MKRPMCTTITPGPETGHPPQKATHQRGRHRKQAVKQAGTQGSADIRCDTGDPPVVHQAFPMGSRASGDPAQLGTLGDGLEVDAFLELWRRLGRRTPSA